MAITTKICRFCGEPFQPYFRLIQRQYACSKPECQRIRQKLNQIDWLERHPNYYRNWYQDYGKAWYQRHPNYHRSYRQRRNVMKHQHHQRLATLTVPCQLVIWVVAGQRKLKSWSLKLTNGTTIYFIKAPNVAVFPLHL